MCHQNSLRRRIDKVITYRKLNKKEKQSRYFNMKARCGKEYQDRNPRYRGAFMCELWEESRESYYEWLDKNFYEVPGENQMDVDKDILQYGNKQYHPDLCLVVPHNIRNIINQNPDADSWFWNGNRKQIKRKLFEKYMDLQKVV